MHNVSRPLGICMFVLTRRVPVFFRNCKESLRKDMDFRRVIELELPRYWYPTGARSSGKSKHCASSPILEGWGLCPVTASL